VDLAPRVRLARDADTAAPRGERNSRAGRAGNHALRLKRRRTRCTTRSSTCSRGPPGRRCAAACAELRIPAECNDLHIGRAGSQPLGNGIGLTRLRLSEVEEGTATGGTFRPSYQRRAMDSRVVALSSYICPPMSRKVRIERVSAMLAPLHEESRTDRSKSTVSGECQ
jgi:hypothetical protein